MVTERAPPVWAANMGKNLFHSLGAGALVLLLGLLSILFYKCYIVIDDRRQYARQVLFHLQLKLCIGVHFSQNLSKMQIPTRICFTFPITNTFLQTRKSAVKSVSKFHLFFRFQSEAQLAKFGINQSGIYKSPITRFNPTPQSTIFRYNHQSTNTRYKHQSPGAYNQSWRKSSFDGSPLHLHSILIFDIKVVFPPGQWTPCLESERFWQKWHCVLLKKKKVSFCLVIAHYT